MHCCNEEWIVMHGRRFQGICSLRKIRQTYSLRGLLLTVTLVAAIIVASKMVVDSYAGIHLLSAVGSEHALETVSENQLSYSVFEYPELDWFIDRLPQSNTERTIEKLLLVLDDSSAVRRRRAVDGLGRLYRRDSTHGTLVAQRLATLTHDEDFDVQFEAHLALKRIAALSN